MAGPSSVVIVGAGLAGAKTAEALRDQGYSGGITLIGSERHLPYERPPLSKGYLEGSTPREEFEVHDKAWYDKHDVDLRLQTTVTHIDRADRVVGLDSTGVGGVLYDRLVLATGSTPRRLRISGADADGVLQLRTVDESDVLKARIADAGRVVVIGAGWIGMEVAAVARNSGADVTVVEAAALPLVGVLGPEIAKSFLALHREHGVDFRLHAQVDAIETSDSYASGVALGDGTTLPAALILTAVGVMPNVQLAADAGLEVDDGVLVDAGLRTSDPDIFAVGDIASHAHPVLARRIRVEHWANALNQPAVAATNILGGDSVYDELPYFFTDQYDLGMEYIGHAPPGSYEQVVVRGDLDGREYIAFWLDGGRRVLAGMNVNVWDVVDDVKALIKDARPVDPARLVDPSVPLADA